MDPELLFSVANLLPLPIWGTWILAPRSRLARTFASVLWPWSVLAALYTVLIAVALSGSNEGSFGSLAGVMTLFEQPWAVLAGWVHYLCFDLFVGRWIVRDAPEAGYRLAPILLLTLFFGPAGLLTYTLTRRWLRSPRPGEPG